MLDGYRKWMRNKGSFDRAIATCACSNREKYGCHSLAVIGVNHTTAVLTCREYWVVFFFCLVMLPSGISPRLLLSSVVCVHLAIAFIFCGHQYFCFMSVETGGVDFSTTYFLMIRLFSYGVYPSCKPAFWPILLHFIFRVKRSFRFYNSVVVAGKLLNYVG